MNKCLQGAQLTKKRKTKKEKKIQGNIKKKHILYTFKYQGALKILHTGDTESLAHYAQQDYQTDV